MQEFTQITILARLVMLPYGFQESGIRANHLCSTQFRSVASIAGYPLANTRCSGGRRCYKSGRARRLLPGRWCRNASGLSPGLIQDEGSPDARNVGISICGARPQLRDVGAGGQLFG